VANIAALADCLSTGAHPPHRPPARLGQELNALAELGRAASAASVCIIAWQAQRAPGLVSAPALEPLFEALVGAGLSMLADQLQAGEHNAAKVLRITGPELALRLGRAVAAPPLELTAASGCDDSAAAIAILMTEPARRGHRVEAILQLLVHTALGTIAADQSSSSRDFWKKRAQAAADAFAGLNRGHRESEAERRRIEDAVAEAWKLPGSSVPAGIGRLVAKVGAFDAWLVVLGDGASVRIEASSPRIKEAAARLPLDERSALVESISRRASILRSANAPPGARCHEDRLFAENGFSSYLCLPFDGGAIALAAGGAIEPAIVGRAEKLVERIAPVIKVRTLEREADARRRLVQSLALRLFGAIDAERARIARDLHDDQAQLLAAARLALTAPRAKANRIFAEIEQRLRARLRALRPATLGRATLRAALAAEVQRLADAGIEARLEVKGARRLKRPLQNVCYQVAREAVSNIIRHSGARHVELSLRQLRDRARLSIVDDGRGIRQRGDRGMGLSGLAERVELIGGSLKIESRRAGTRVVAEIPVPTLSRA
jgi:signal transduction histidine kinase